MELCTLMKMTTWVCMLRILDHQPANSVGPGTRDLLVRIWTVFSSECSDSVQGHPQLGLSYSGKGMHAEEKHGIPKQVTAAQEPSPLHIWNSSISIRWGFHFLPPSTVLDQTAHRQRKDVIQVTARLQLRTCSSERYVANVKRKTV